MVRPRFFAKGSQSYPLPGSLAVAFGEKPDLPVRSREFCGRYDITVKKGTDTSNEAEGEVTNPL